VRSVAISVDNETCYLVIDQGGHATRAIVFDAVGKIVCAAEASIKTISRNTLEVEHDPVDLLNSVYSAIDEVYQILGDDYLKIKQAGLATQRSSIVCWDKQSGEALSPIISWQDRRTSGNLSPYKKHAAYIHDVTGLYLNPHYGATKMRWCLDNLAEVKQALEQSRLCIAPMASFILFHLLNKNPFFIDPANASRSLMMNYKTLAWQPELLDLFSVSENILPEIVLTKTSYGDLVRHQHRIPLLLCTGDQSAAVYSEGRPSADEVFINAGTGAFVLKSSDQIPDLKNEKILTSVVFADKNQVSYVVEGTVNGGGRALHWFSEQTGIVEYESQLDQWCADCFDPPIFINAISGVGSPYWVAEYASYFTEEASNEAKFVAVLESIIFLLAENIACIQKISGQINKIRLAGGITRSRFFSQKLCNLLQTPVILAQESEATAKGVYYLLSGHTPEKADAILRGATFSTPSIISPRNDEKLMARYTRWRRIMSSTFLTH